MSDLKPKQIVYYTRIIPSSNIYDVYELKIRTVEEDWFVGIEKRDKQAFLFYDKDIGNVIFTDREDALNKAKDAEAKRKEVSNETYYEEY